MKKEHILFIVVGFFLLSYLLDAVVNPLNLSLATPYQFFSPKYLAQYAFTTVSIVLKSIAILLTPILFLNFLGISNMSKGITILILSALLQLYALQDVATNNQVVPLEWSLSFSLGGLLLLIPAVFYIISGAIKNMNQQLTNEARSHSKNHHKPTQLQPLDK